MNEEELKKLVADIKSKVQGEDLIKLVQLLGEDEKQPMEEEEEEKEEKEDEEEEYGKFKKKIGLNY